MTRLLLHRALNAYTKDMRLAIYTAFVVVCLTLLATSCSGKRLQDNEHVLRKNNPPFPMPTFDCPALSTPPPAKDVRHLKPGNIKAIMAIGDSISAGFGMVDKAYVEQFLEYRGRVFSIGGDDDAVSLPKFLSHYSPNITGQAHGNTVPMTKGKYLDAGVSMAVVQQTEAQVDYLVNQLTTTYKDSVDIYNDWKMLTVFIGANNLCRACSLSNSSWGNMDNYETSLRTTLLKVRSEIPKVFVNVVKIFNISQVYTTGQNDKYCRMVWDVVTECTCLTKGTDSDRHEMDIAKIDLNNRIDKVAAEMQELNDPGFTVVAQPVLEHMKVPSEDYLSNLDCFHPNQYADAAFAVGVWNSMFLPADKKPHNLNPQKLDIYCPTEDDYIQ